MKKVNKFTIIYLISLYAIIIIASVVFIALKDYAKLIVILLPSAFLLPIFYTFEKTPNKVDDHTPMLVLLTVGRYALMVLTVLIPALLYYYIPYCKENVSSYLLILPAIEVLLIYLLVFLRYLLISKLEDK